MKTVNLNNYKRTKKQQEATRYYHCTAVMAKIRDLNRELERLDFYIDIPEIKQVITSTKIFLINRIIELEGLSKCEK